MWTVGQRPTIAKLLVSVPGSRSTTRHVAAAAVVVRTFPGHVPSTRTFVACTIRCQPSHTKKPQQNDQKNSISNKSRTHQPVVLPEATSNSVPSPQPKSTHRASAPSLTPTSPELSRATRSRLRFEEALHDLEKARGSAKKLWSGIRGYLPWTKTQPSNHDNRVFNSMEDSDIKMKMPNNNTWFFALQPLRFPTDPDWPPPLPGIKDDYACTPGSPTWKAPRRSPGVQFRELTYQHPRELAALALDVHRYGLPPRLDVYHFEGETTERMVWMQGYGRLGELDDEQLVWSQERFSRLEFLGDAIVKEIATRIVYSSFPDLAPNGVSTAAAHMCTNDTLSFLYQLSGLAELRERLARELLLEAVSRELELEEKKAATGYHKGRRHLPDAEDIVLELAPIDRIGKADRFEAYLAYVRIVHGSEVAENWFADLVQPWVDRIARDTSWPTERSVSQAGHTRRRLDEAKEHEERREREALHSARFSRFGSMTISGSSLIQRLLGRDSPRERSQDDQSSQGKG